MKVQRFKGSLKYVNSEVDDLILYKDKDNGQIYFIEDLRWREGSEFAAQVYDLDMFDSIQEYFIEV